MLPHIPFFKCLQGIYYVNQAYSIFFIFYKTLHFVLVWSHSSHNENNNGNNQCVTFENGPLGVRVLPSFKLDSDFKSDVWGTWGAEHCGSVVES